MEQSLADLPSPQVLPFKWVDRDVPDDLASTDVGGSGDLNAGKPQHMVAVGAETEIKEKKKNAEERDDRCPDAAALDLEFGSCAVSHIQPLQLSRLARCTRTEKHLSVGFDGAPCGAEDVVTGAAAEGVSSLPGNAEFRFSPCSMLNSAMADADPGDEESPAAEESDTSKISVPGEDTQVQALEEDGEPQVDSAVLQTTDDNHQGEGEGEDAMAKSDVDRPDLQPKPTDETTVNDGVKCTAEAPAEVVAPPAAVATTEVPAATAPEDHASDIEPATMSQPQQDEKQVGWPCCSWPYRVCFLVRDSLVSCVADVASAGAAAASAGGGDRLQSH